MAAAIDGIVLLDKPLGLSSNAALQRVKYIFGARKAGHSGSLDPLASGMLPICLGEATKVSATLLDARKCYRFTVQLGARTATGDVEGEVIETLPVPEVTAQRLTGVLAGFLGPQVQVPPMYSAVKQDGQRLYALARKGVEIERKPRPIDLYALELENFAGASLTVKAECSKGTYIRVLAEDLAKSLGTCGHVTLLRRLWVEPFGDEPMVTLDQLQIDERTPTELLKHLLPLDRGLAGWPRIDLDDAQAVRLLHGQRLRLSAASGSDAAVRVYGPANLFLGLADLDATGLLTPRRLISGAA